jgi:hypothetical protein
MVMEKRQLAEVFKSVGLPSYTYIKPSYYGEVRADIEQPGNYRFPKATDREIDRLIDAGEQALIILFEDGDILLSESSGNFWLAQY